MIQTEKERILSKVQEIAQKIGGENPTAEEIADAKILLVQLETDIGATRALFARNRT